MKLEPGDLLKLADKLNATNELLEKQGDIEVLLKKFSDMEDYLKRFTSLAELTKYFKEIEEKAFFCKTFFPTNEATKYLKISKWTLLEAVKRHEIPYYTPPGKSYYFAKDDLDKWVMKFKVPSIAQTETREIIRKQR